MKNLVTLETVVERLMEQNCIFTAFDGDLTTEAKEVFDIVFNFTMEELMNHIEDSEGIKYSALSLSYLIMSC